VRDHGARSAEARGAGLPCHHLIEASMAFRERESAERFLDIVCQSAKSVAEGKAPVIRCEHLCLFEPCLGV